MTSEPKPRKRQRHADRITLAGDALSRIDRWVTELAPRLRGTRMTRTDLVNWVLLNRQLDLAEPEKAQIETQFFDPVKALEWATRQAKAARAAGEPVDLGAFVNQAILARPRIVRKPALKKKGADGTSDQAPPPVAGTDVTL